MPIPYPKRDFLTDDDQEEKPSEKQQPNNQGNNQGNHGHGQDQNHGAKRMRQEMGPPQRHNVSQGNGHSMGYNQNQQQQQNQGFRFN